MKEVTVEQLRKVIQQQIEFIRTTNKENAPQHFNELTNLLKKYEGKFEPKEYAEHIRHINIQQENIVGNNKGVAPYVAPVVVPTATNIKTYPAAKKAPKSKLVRNIIALGTAVAIGFGINSLMNKKEESTTEVDTLSTNSSTQQIFMNENEEEMDRLLEFGESLYEEGVELEGMDYLSFAAFALDRQATTDLFASYMTEDNELLDPATRALNNANEVSNKLAQTGNVPNYSILFDGEEKEALAGLEANLDGFIKALAENNKEDQEKYKDAYNAILAASLNENITEENIEFAMLVGITTLSADAQFGLTIDYSFIQQYTNEDGLACTSMGQVYNNFAGLYNRFVVDKLDINFYVSMENGYLKDETGVDVSEVLRDMYIQEYKDALLKLEKDSKVAYEKFAEIVAVHGRITQGLSPEKVEDILREQQPGTHDGSAYGDYDGDGTLEYESNVEVGDVVEEGFRPNPDAGKDLDDFIKEEQEKLEAEQEKEQAEAEQDSALTEEEIKDKIDEENQNHLDDLNGVTNDNSNGGVAGDDNTNTDDEPPIVGPEVPFVPDSETTFEPLSQEDIQSQIDAAVASSATTHEKVAPQVSQEETVTFSSAAEIEQYVQSVVTEEVPVTDTNSVVIEQDVTLTKGN